MATIWRYPAYANKPGHFTTDQAVEIALTRNDAGQAEMVALLSRLVDILHEADLLTDQQVADMMGFMFEVAV